MKVKLIGVMAELANVACPRNPGSNLGTDRKYFPTLFVSHLNSNH
jgi:hypothetical protein